jgi:hypothetical protein
VKPVRNHISSFIKGLEYVGQFDTGSHNGCKADIAELAPVIVMPHSVAKLHRQPEIMERESACLTVCQLQEFEFKVSEDLVLGTRLVQETGVGLRHDPKQQEATQVNQQASAECVRQLVLHQLRTSDTVVHLRSAHRIGYRSNIATTAIHGRVRQPQDTKADRWVGFYCRLQVNGGGLRPLANIQNVQRQSRVRTHAAQHQLQRLRSTTFDT